MALHTVRGKKPTLTQLVEGPGLHTVVNITTTGRIAASLTLSNPSPATDLRDVFLEDCSSHRNLSAFRPATPKAASLTPCVRPPRANIYTESFYLSVLFSSLTPGDMYYQLHCTLEIKQFLELIIKTTMNQNGWIYGM